MFLEHVRGEGTTGYEGAAVGGAPAVRDSVLTLQVGAG